MAKDVYAEYDSKERIIHGFMPFLGPLYLLGRYIGNRWTNRNEIREGRERLEKLVKEIKTEFKLAV